MISYMLSYSSESDSQGSDLEMKTGFMYIALSCVWAEAWLDEFHSIQNHVNMYMDVR